MVRSCSQEGGQLGQFESKNFLSLFYPGNSFYVCVCGFLKKNLLNVVL